MLNNKDIEKLSEVFATKEDMKDFAKKEDVTGFKGEILKGQDEIIDKLNILLDEKTVGDEQDKRRKKVLEIHNGTLKRSKILSEGEASEVDNLQVF